MSAVDIGIAGVGLIGGSIALRARAAGATVLGFDSDPGTRSTALERGAVNAFAPDLAALAGQCRILVIALPVDATAAALEALSAAPAPAPELIMDVASVKAPLGIYGAHLTTYVGTHPMAGREQGGINFAQAGLFENATWAHVPHPEAALVAKTRAFIVAMGGIPLEIDAPTHDAIVALTSHLPQALSVTLGAELATAAQHDARVMELCGPGMISMLRLARSPQKTWSPILSANAGPIAERLRSVSSALARVAAALEAGEVAPLLEFFEDARGAAVALEERFSPTARSSTYASPQNIPHSSPPRSR